MRFLVTGGAGFIGSHLIDLLLEDQENQVVSWDSFTTGKKENLIKAAETGRLLAFQMDTINAADYRMNRDLHHEFDVIFHLAAEARIQPSFDKIATTYRSNILGTASVIQYAKDTGCKKIVFVSSSTVDDDPMKNPYAMTKHQGEELMKMAAKIYGISTVSVRPYNVYGARQLDDGPYSTVIGIFERQTTAGEQLSVTGDGEQRRDFTHVSDIAKGMVHVSKTDYQGDVFGLGTGVNYSINEVADMFQPGAERVWLEARPGEAKTSLAQNMPPEWKASVNLRDYVKATTSGPVSNNGSHKLPAG